MLFHEMLPPGQVLAEGAALSPDGRSLAFVASDANGRRQLWLRTLDSQTARPVADTDGALAPFWAPDSKSVAYFIGNHIKRTERTGGLQRPIVTTRRGLPLGGTWTATDQILFCDQGKIYAVNASGGVPSVVIQSRPSLTGDFKWPRALADGHQFLFVVTSDDPNEAGTYLGNLESHEAVRVLSSSDSPAEYVAPGYIVYIHDHELLAQQFKPGSRLKGQPTVLLGDLSDTIDLSSALNGLLSINEYKHGARAAWVDRTGRELSSFAVPSLFQNIALSPDGTRALATSFEAGTLALWQIDLKRNVSMRIATNAGYPAWSPDGSQYAYIRVGTGGAADVSVRSTTELGNAIWLKNDKMKVVTDWSMDGRYIFISNDRQGVWVIPTAGDHSAWPAVELSRNTVSAGARLSPDGRALAYISDESGTQEIYITSFPHTATRQQVSTSGGKQPLWRRDGDELFFFSNDRHVTAVATPGDHQSPGRPQSLFTVTGASGPFGVSQDGQRFLVIERDHSADHGAISLLTNWLGSR
jgi:Tol biopolymer transport system component